MTLKVQHKRSAVKGKAPLPTDLEYGEIAVNYEATDPALYIKDSADAVRKIGTQPAATETTAGIVELATAAETTTGTDATRAVHPAGLKVELDKKVKLSGDTMTGNLTVPKLISTGDVQAHSLNGGQLAGFRNVLINGDLRINQRGVDVAAAAVGAYGHDRWKKVDAGNMTQIVENVNYIPGATYTLSGTGVTTQQLTAPASGHWTLPNIPITASNVQLEVGTVATPFEHRLVGVELVLCQRYYELGSFSLLGYVPAAGANIGGWASFRSVKRAAPVVITSTHSNFGAVPSTSQVLDITGDGFTCFRTGTGVGTGQWVDRWTASAEL